MCVGQQCLWVALRKRIQRSCDEYDLLLFEYQFGFPDERLDFRNTSSLYGIVPFYFIYIYIYITSASLLVNSINPNLPHEVWPDDRSLCAGT